MWPLFFSLGSLFVQSVEMLTKFVLGQDKVAHICFPPSQKYLIILQPPPLALALGYLAGIVSASSLVV
jgi:hypothetical protein